MHRYWLALGAALTLSALPALGQTDTTATPGVTTPDASAATTPMTDNMAPPISVTPPGVIGGTPAMLDVTAFRTSLDALRGYIAKILENDRSMGAAADVVAADPYRRANETLLDNAESVALNALGQLGTAVTTPDDLRLTRVQLLQVWDALHRARLMTDYDLIVHQASLALDHTYQAFDSRSAGSAAMAGQHMDIDAATRDMDAAIEAARRRQLEAQASSTTTTTQVAVVPAATRPAPVYTPAPEVVAPPVASRPASRRVETATVRHTTRTVRYVRRARAQYKWVWVCRPVKIQRASHVRRTTNVRHVAAVRRPITHTRRVAMRMPGRTMKPGYRCHWVRVRVRVR